MDDYYEILGVDRSSSLYQVKRAFRARAKSFHPDVDPSGSNSHRMRLLITAYEVLCDPEQRQEYDRLHARIDKKNRFNYREFLKRQKGNERSMAKLIFFDLLHDYEDEAVAIFDDLVYGQGFELSEYLDREDFMDCLFLLAEEYEKRGEYIKSYDLLRLLVLYECKQPYFRHFFREVVDRLRLISCFRMPGVIEDDLLIAYLEELVEFDFSAKDTAFFLKRIAEIYAERDAVDEAIFYLKEGLDLHAKLPGIKKLREKLGYVANAVV